jgi:trk system potassium uptake protein TrkA
MRIAIAGAGAVGRSVARELLDNGHKVLLIEREREKYQPEAVPDADWFLADACELASLVECGMETCDIVIAATGDDKVNLAAALLAKSEFAVSRVVARVNEMRNERLFTEAWGIDVAVSTPRAIVAATEGTIDVGHLVRLMELRHGHKVEQLTLPADNPLVGRTVRDLALPENTALMVVLRGGQVVVPRPDDVLQAGDRMVFAASSGAEEQIRAAVHASPPLPAE